MLPSRTSDMMQSYTRFSQETNKQRNSRCKIHSTSKQNEQHICKFELKTFDSFDYRLEARNYTKQHESTHMARIQVKKKLTIRNSQLPYHSILPQNANPKHTTLVQSPQILYMKFKQTKRFSILPGNRVLN